MDDMIIKLVQQGKSARMQRDEWPWPLYDQRLLG